MSLSNRNNYYNNAEVETAIVVHEWLTENRSNADDAASPLAQLIENLFNSYGSSAMRSIAIHVGVIVEKCWLYAGKHYGDAYTDDIMWDWDFVPMICRNLDWDQLAQNNQYGGGEWEPDYDRFMSTIEAARALKVE
jgi:hypothetical protein